MRWIVSALGVLSFLAAGIYFSAVLYFGGKVLNVDGGKEGVGLLAMPNELFQKYNELREGVKQYQAEQVKLLTDIRSDSERDRSGADTEKRKNRRSGKTRQKNQPPKS